MDSSCEIAFWSRVTFVLNLRCQKSARVFGVVQLAQFRCRCRPPEQMAVMAVPEAAMHEDNDAASRKDKVGTSWKPAIVQQVAKARRMNVASNSQLSKRILGAYGGHHP